MKEVDNIIHDTGASCGGCGSKNVFGMSRVVGYFSQIDNWNAAKLAELKDRKAGDYKLDSSKVEFLGEKKEQEVIIIR